MSGADGVTLRRPARANLGRGAAPQGPLCYPSRETQGASTVRDARTLHLVTKSRPMVFVATAQPGIMTSENLRPAA